METQNPNPNPNTQPEQPPLKKPKMSSSSTTTNSDDDGAGKPVRYKRRKIAIFFAYCGVGYQGMQKNPGAKTIEEDLEEALFLSGAVPEADRGQPKRFDWARSARTDKGVSAVGQVVSGRFYVDPPGFIQRLNSNLCPQIRIFGYKRTIPSFNAKKFCDRRRYVYLLPVFALDSKCHRDRESVLASLGSGNELAKCFECSERGRKVIGLMGNKRDSDFCGLVQSDISSNNRDALLISGENGVGIVNSDGFVQSSISLNNVDALVVNDKEDSRVSVEKNNNGDVSIVDSESVVLSGISSNSEAALLITEKKESNVCSDDNGVAGLNSESVEDDESKVIGSEFKYGEEVRNRFNRILKHYVGTHNFHNFTTRTKAEDPSAKRYIVSFEANTTLTLEGIEFVKCEVIGQSFMLHQIRKMMGILKSMSLLPLKWGCIWMNVSSPRITTNGKNTHEEVSMKDYAEEAEEFKMKYIYSHVAKTKLKEGSVAVWLHSLNHRNYPDLCPPNDEVKEVDINEVERVANNEVERAVNNDMKETANSEVKETANNEVKETANSEVKETANNEVKETANDKVERMANNEGNEAAKNEVDKMAKDEMVKTVKDDVARADNDEVEGGVDGMEIGEIS
ncbi:tRNA pseudouridine synthase 1 [Bienertia sinuspersici]